LNFERRLRRLQTILQLVEQGERSRSQINAVTEREQPGHDDEDRDDAEEGPYAQSAGTHGRDFAVGGEAAQSNEDADEDAHGNGVGERHGHGEEKDFSDARQGSAIANDKFEDAPEVASEKDKSKNAGADERVGDDFSQNVAGEDAHPQGRWTQMRV